MLELFLCPHKRGQLKQVLLNLVLASALRHWLLDGWKEGQAFARPGYRLMLLLPGLLILKQGTLSLSALMLYDFLCLV